MPGSLSRSFPTGDPPSTYSAMLTPSAPVSEDRGERTEAGSLPGKLPGLRWSMCMGFERGCAVKRSYVMIRIH